MLNIVWPLSLVADNQVWRFRHNQLDTGFPKALDPYHFPETIRFVLTMVDADGYSRVFVFGVRVFLYIYTYIYFFCADFYPPGPFTCIFSKTSPEFSCVGCG